MRDEFEVAWKTLDADPEVRVIVHTGEGRAFQTGVDVTELASDGQGMERYRESVEQWDLHFTAWHNEVWKPVITAVNGICAGGAFHWVADADIVIAASDATFFDPHVSVGQVVAIEAIGLMKRIPVEAVMRMAFVGRYERMPAQRAYELGMISEIVDPPERLRDAAQELAEKIAKNSPAAMAATKRALWAAMEHGLTDACRAGAAGARFDVGSSRSGGRPARLRREARRELAATHPRGVIVSDPVTIGTAVVAYIEPHAGAARAFNRWYERDHFYAAAMAGPGMFAGARWVATRDCKAGRPENDALRRPRAWFLPRDVLGAAGHATAWDEWAAAEYAKTPADRLFAARDHIHTAMYRFRWDARTEDAPPPATALDHGFAGVIAIASVAPADWLADWSRKHLSNEMHLLVALASARTIMTTTDAVDHVLLLGFCRADPLRVWRDQVAPALPEVPGLGFASPFLRTVPGTDAYVDDL